MRPILMTTLSMAIGMLPIALASGVQQPNGKTVGLGDYWRFTFVIGFNRLFSSNGL